MTAGLVLLRLWEFHFLELVRGLEQWWLICLAWTWVRLLHQPLGFANRFIVRFMLFRPEVLAGVIVAACIMASLTLAGWFGCGVVVSWLTIGLKI